MLGKVKPTSMLPTQLTRVTTGTAAVRGPCRNSSEVINLGGAGGQFNHEVALGIN